VKKGGEQAIFSERLSGFSLPVLFVGNSQVISQERLVVFLTEPAATRVLDAEQLQVRAKRG
jgi:hypothetical protein